MPGKLNQDKIRKMHESQQQGGELLKFDPGETLVFVHPPCREDDEWEPTTGTPVVPITVHYNVGPNDSMVASLDPDNNEVLDHPFIKKFLKERKIKISGSCPVKEAMESGEMSEEEMDASRAKTQYLIGMTPVSHRPKPSGPWTELPRKPGVAMVGRQIFDGVMEILMELDEDVVDMNGCVLLKIQRTGKDRNTKYKVAPDPKTARTPFKFKTSEKKAILKAMEEGGECDLFRVAASMIKSSAAVRSIIEGGEVSEDPEEFDDDDEDESPKKSKGKSTKWKSKRKPEPEPDDEDDLDDEPEDDDEDEEKTPPPKKSKAKPAGKSEPKKAPPPEPEPDDEDDLDEDDEPEDDDDEDDEPEPSKKSKSKAKSGGKSKAKAPPPEDDDDDEDDLDDDDDDREDDDDEPEHPKKSKAKSKSKAKAKSDDDDDEDDDDMDLDELESRLEDAAGGGDDGDDEADDDDEEPSRPAKKAASEPKSKSKTKARSK